MEDAGNKKLGIKNYFPLIIFILMLLSVLVYKFYPRKSIEAISTSTLTTISEKQYKKYVNKNLGYELTIPGNFSYEEKMDGKFVTLGNKIIIYLLDSDPEKCEEDCPVIDSKEELTINNQKVRFFKCHWKYDGLNTPQNFVNYIFNLKGQYLVIQLQEVDFNSEININRQINDLDPQELNEFNKIVQSITFTQ